MAPLVVVQVLVEALRRDSTYIHSALTQGVEASIRLFSCQGCDSYWWRKVPARKEVSHPPALPLVEEGARQERGKSPPPPTRPATGGGRCPPKKR